MKTANQMIGFEIMVWADDNGQPGVLLGTSDGATADPGTELNGFRTYYFDTPVRVTDNFWIGWKQNGEVYLNAGLDLNTPPVPGDSTSCFSGNLADPASARERW
ncbi:MAG: hypothetical protein U5L72_14115 [Bacteroidales bacterium]|nr:hypothetical protein [Bacteroidales bacterium]